MARGINKVILIGNLGADPEVKFMPSGQAVANVTLATSESWNDKATGEKVEKTEWHRVVFFRRLAEIVGEYCKKGSKIYVEGRLQTRKWQDQSGNDRYTTEVVGDQMQMLDSKGDGEYHKMPEAQPNQDASNAAAGAQGAQDSQGKSQGGFDDDIPF